MGGFAIAYGVEVGVTLVLAPDVTGAVVAGVVVGLGRAVAVLVGLGEAVALAVEKGDALAGVLRTAGLAIAVPFAGLPLYASNSARPTLPVADETLVTVSRSVVVARAVNVITVAVPSLLSDGTVTVVPSEKVRVPPVIWSLPLGRS